ncbi:MAG: protease HtpX [Candidatus Dasytiphilus stammeri]
MKRIVLFLLTNISVMIGLGIILSLIGLKYSIINRLLLTAVLVGFSGSLISLFLSKKLAVQAVSGKYINKPCDEREKWLITTVNQQSKKSGIKSPQVVIYQAKDINAFATGAFRNNSVVAVSTGLLNNMTKPEAEAVLAHEISHIVNGDMVTMTLLQGVVNTFVIFLSRIIAYIASGLLSGERDMNHNHHHSFHHSLIYMFITTTFEAIFGIFASIITMWFSRRREFSADAGSARLVGKEKMIAALQQLKTSCAPTEDKTVSAFCINGKKYNSLSEIFMSHPPLDKRIEALRRMVL